MIQILGYAAVIIGAIILWFRYRDKRVFGYLYLGLVGIFIIVAAYVLSSFFSFSPEEIALGHKVRLFADAALVVLLVGLMFKHVRDSKR
jgi:hypothetical protein